VISYNYTCFLQEQVRTLREQLGQLQQAAGVSPVDQALVLVRQLAARPPNVFDPYALIGALENLEDVARRSGHQDLKKYAAVVSHCKKLPPNARLGDFVTHVLGDEVEREVAKTVAKMYKPTVNTARFDPTPRLQSVSRPKLAVCESWCIPTNIQRKVFQMPSVWTFCA
jgi:hypothetical protein